MTVSGASWAVSISFFDLIGEVVHGLETARAKDALRTLIAEATAAKQRAVRGVALVGDAIPVLDGTAQVGQRPAIACRGGLRPKEGTGVYWRTLSVRSATWAGVSL